MGIVLSCTKGGVRSQGVVSGVIPPVACVIRARNEFTTPSADVVPGDVVRIKTGDTITPDIRLFETMDQECDEKILTGEALPVAKSYD